VPLPRPNGPDASTSGWRRYVQAAKLKALRPNLSGFLSTPTPAPALVSFSFWDLLQCVALDSFHQKGCAMLLKDIPESFSLNYSVHVLALMLQSILIRAEEMIDQQSVDSDADKTRALHNLTEILSTALRDAESLQKRMMN
jgi:hypothetical protein